MRLFLIAIFFMYSFDAQAEISLCDGAWENGESVHVIIDWDKMSVNINGVITTIKQVKNNGIITNNHTNKIGHPIVFAIISSTYNAYAPNGVFLYKSAKFKTFVMQLDLLTQESIFSHGLNCTKSFTKPLMARII